MRSFRSPTHNGMGTDEPDVDRCSGTFSALLLAHVVRAAGKDGARQMLRATGENPKVIGDPNEWIENDRLARLADAAGDVLGDRASVGRGIATEIARWNEMMGEHDRFRTLGHPAEVLRRYALQGSRMNTAYAIEIEESDDDHAVIALTYREGSTPMSLFCDLHLQLYVTLAETIGAAAAATHPMCAVRGDDACRFDVRWSDANVYGANDSSSIVERLQATARDLAAATDDDAMLTQAVEGVRDLTLPAPEAAVLVVDLENGERLVRHVGFAEEAETQRAIERIVGEDDARPEERVAYAVPLDSGRATYGTLAVFFPPGSYITVQDERMYTAYAQHIAAALEVKRTLAGAQRDRDTATAVLDLARSLSSATSRREAVELIEAAIPITTGCDDVAVWLLDHETRVLARGEQVIGRSTIHAATLHELTVLDGDDASLLHNPSSDVAVAAVVPLTAGDQLIGVLSAAWRDGTTKPGPTVLGRLQGMADQGALALQVVGLLERIHHQALHDELTGLPNRTLLKDRAEQAILSARRDDSHIGLLFVDLDRFKVINDTLGHATGDAVLRIVADRLRSSVRGSDTVARVGGDEFVVLLPTIHDEDDAVNVAERIRKGLRAPVLIGGRVVDVSCTVGVTVGDTSAGGWDDLLRAADTAMYEGKQDGRDAVRIA